MGPKALYQNPKELLKGSKLVKLHGRAVKKGKNIALIILLDLAFPLWRDGALAGQFSLAESWMIFSQ
jgi:hypothetical protein